MPAAMAIESLEAFRMQDSWGIAFFGLYDRFCMNVGGYSKRPEFFFQFAENLKLRGFSGVHWPYTVSSLNILSINNLYTRKADAHGVKLRGSPKDTRLWACCKTEWSV